MAKIKLIWVECPKCEGEGGEDVFGADWDYYGSSGWLECWLCKGEGKTQMGIPEEEVKHETKTQT